MREATSFLQQSLAEHGISGASVTRESKTTSETFYITQEFGDKTFKTQRDTPPIGQYISTESDKKRLAISAQSIAQEMENWLSETIECGDSIITLYLYDEPEAICETCGATASVSQCDEKKTDCAEMSVPQPNPVDRSVLFSSLDAHTAVSVKMYLIGKLKRECDTDCPNSR